ncbi:hypothetical protein Tco_0260700 [Tanacetum coccineum]
MLDKTQYRSWASRMLLYIKGKENKKLLVNSFLNGPFKYGTVTEAGIATTPATVRARRYDELTDGKKIHEACDIKATNIILQGLPQDIYNLVNHHEEAEHIWDRVKLLIQGSEISLQERESKLYDEFDIFTLVPGETIHSYYLRQHEAHADEVRIMKERFLNPLALQQVSPLASQQLFIVPMVQQRSYQTLVANYSSVVHHQSYQAPEIFVKGNQTHDNYPDNHVIDQNMQEMQYSEQPDFNNEPDIDITTQRKVPALYCGNTIVKQHAALSVIDTKETLKLAEESRLKMHAKQNDPIVQEKKVNIAPIDYVALNKLSMPFVPQKKLFAQFKIPPVQPKLVLKEIPRELPIISLVEDRFNKMRSHVNDYENVVTVRTKVTGQNEGSWGFEHIKKAFEKDVKPFVKSLKEYFHMFDQGLHKEIIDMKEVFTQMETEAVKCLVERKTFEIKEKELLLENDRLLELLIS